MSDNKHVLLTGASGFVAMHILRELIEHGYKVTGTVRSPLKAEEIYDMYPDWKPSLTFEYVPDIADENAFRAVFEKNHDKLDYVLHTASPVTFEVSDIQKELIDPAVQGVRNILRDAHELGGSRIKRFILLASAVAVLNSYDDIGKPGKPYNEDDWNPVTAEDAISQGSAVLGYNASKKLSELAAWDFIKKEKPSFDLCTINPDIIIGPPLQKIPKPTAVNETNAFAVYNFINGTYKRVEDTRFPFYHFVDVRDVANGTIALLETPTAAGNRILFVANTITPQLVVNIIRKHFPGLKERLVKGGDEDQTFPLGVDPTGWDVSRSSSILSRWNGLKGGSWTYIQLEKSVVDTVNKLLELEAEWA